MVLSSQVMTELPTFSSHKSSYSISKTRMRKANSTLNENLTVKHNICWKEATCIMFQENLPYEKNPFGENDLGSYANTLSIKEDD
jgi:hypothetical protein